MDQELRLIVWETTETTDDLLKELHCPQSIAEYSRLTSEKRRKEFLAVRVALKRALGKEHVIIYDNDGKPYLSDNCFNISISHSGSWVAVVLHPARPVGIDLECVGKKVQRVYKRFLCAEEQNHLLGDKSVEKLHIAWSAKEAAYKIIGKEAVDFSTQLYVEPFEVKEKGKLITIHTTSGKKYYFDYLQAENYVLVYGIG